MARCSICGKETESPEQKICNACADKLYERSIMNSVSLPPKKHKILKYIGISISAVIVLFIALAIIGAHMPTPQVTTQTLVDATDVSIHNHYSNLDLMTGIHNASVTDIGNSKYEISGTMNSLSGGFIYQIDAIIEVSPDRTETRVDQLNVVQAN